MPARSRSAHDIIGIIWDIVIAGDSAKKKSQINKTEIAILVYVLRIKKLAKKKSERKKVTD